MDDNLKKWLPWIAVAAVAIVVVAIIAINSGGDDDVAGAGDTTTTTAVEESTTTTVEDTTTTTAEETTTTTEAPVIVRVGVENAYLPFNFIDEAGDAVGFDYDIWNEICNRLDCTAEFIEAGWPAVIEETGQGVYDVAADGITITDDRKKVVDFSDPYMITIQKLMVRIGEDRFTNLAEFQDGDFRLGTQVGTTNYELGASLVDEARIDAYDQFGLAVEALIRGDVDAVIIDEIAGQGYLGVSKDQTSLLEDDLQSDPLGFIFPIGSELTAQVNQVIADMDADGTLDAIITKWFVDFEG
ncbi:MAG: substrate-binding periplasmic protein [Acidimicrobiia bacterium]